MGRKALKKVRKKVGDGVEIDPKKIAIPLESFN